MIKIENFEVMGWEHAIRGMRNPMNSWDRMDSAYCAVRVTCRGCPYNDLNGHCRNETNERMIIGPNDLDLMKRLVKGGPVHAKFRRMITVYVDLTAPLYWWKEFDTYKVGTVANSCSTMHKIAAKEFTLDDFSHEKLVIATQAVLENVIECLNTYRNIHNAAKDPEYKESMWHQMIQLLPSSYNQKRTVMLNYEVLANMYEWRKNHKLHEWRDLCKWIETLPYSEIITGKVEVEE
jgi:hypothetical protein